jgi:hypothetical protein
MSNLAFVYFFEYSITTSFGIQAVNKISANDQTNCDNNFALQQAFIILNFCYQIGVFFSRSSLQFFVIERTWIVTLL